MAITGTWKDRAVISEEYTGATRWGNGVNPVHAVRYGPQGEQGRVISVAGAGQEPPPEEILGPAMWGYSVEEQMLYGGEDYRYMEEDHPNWGETTVGRADRDGEIMEQGEYPQPEGWPSWGPHDNGEADFPLPGSPGGAAVRSYSDGLDVERRRAIAVPTQGVSGGWLNKQRGEQLEARTSDPSQYEVTTSMRQVHQSYVNDRALARYLPGIGGDEPRTAIRARTAGVKLRYWAKDFEQGGGPGTPRMFPFQQDLMYRPFYFRSPGLPPSEPHTWNEMTQFSPIQRTTPDDPYMGEQSGATQDTSNDYGYTNTELY